MRNYSFQAKNPAGRLRRGRLPARSETAARAELRSRGLQVLDLVDRGVVQPSLAQRLQAARLPSVQEKAVSVKQFAVMVQSGLPLDRCLEVLGRDPNLRLGRAWSDLQSEVLKGNTLSRGMGRNADVFGMIFVGMARAGEMSGALGTVLEELARVLEREAALRARIRAATTYPALVLCVCLGLAFVLVQHVLPTFLNGILQGMEDLPWMTRLLVGGTQAFTTHYLLGVGLVGGGVALLIGRQHLHTARGRYQYELLLLSAPVLSALCRRVVLARFCHILSALLASGTTAVHALEVTSSSLANQVVARVVDGIRCDLKDGCTIGEAFAASGFFPSMMTRLVHVAEQSGDLIGMLNRIARIYEEELETALDSTTAALEPLMVAVMGGFVGFVVIALFLPLYRLLSTL